MITKIKDFLCNADSEALAWGIISIALVITGIVFLPLVALSIIGTMIVFTCVIFAGGYGLAVLIEKIQEKCKNK